MALGERGMSINERRSVCGPALALGYGGYVKSMISTLSHCAIFMLMLLKYFENREFMINF